MPVARNSGRKVDLVFAVIESCDSAMLTLVVLFLPLPTSICVAMKSGHRSSGSEIGGDVISGFASIVEVAIQWSNALASMWRRRSVYTLEKYTERCRGRHCSH